MSLTLPPLPPRPPRARTRPARQTYVFWNVHEPEKGRFRWSGDADLGRFIQVCES